MTSIHDQLTQALLPGGLYATTSAVVNAESSTLTFDKILAVKRQLQPVILYVDNDTMTVGDVIVVAKTSVKSFDALPPLATPSFVMAHPDTLATLRDWAWQNGARLEHLSLYTDDMYVVDLSGSSEHKIKLSKLNIDIT